MSPPTVRCWELARREYGWREAVKYDVSSNHIPETDSGLTPHSSRKPSLHTRRLEVSPTLHKIQYSLSTAFELLKMSDDLRSRVRNERDRNVGDLIRFEDAFASGHSRNSIVDAPEATTLSRCY